MAENIEKRNNRRINGVVVVNQNQIQSYVLTTAKYDFSTYEKRLLYLLVQMARTEYCEFDELKFPRDCHKLIKVDKTDLYEVTVPLSAMLAHDGDKNHALVKQALHNLSIKGFEYEDTDTGEWQFINIISYPKIKKRDGKVTFYLNKKIWECCLDFTRGYRKYELTVAMKFKCAYSMRFYELVSNQKKPMEFTIENLKQMFCISDKYKLNADFRRKVLDSAKKELDACSPYTFTYTLIKQGRKATSVLIYPVHQPKYEDTELANASLRARTSLSWDLDSNVIKQLEDIKFTRAEIEKNRTLLSEAQRLFSSDFDNKLRDIIHRSHDRAKNIKAYVIGSIRKAIEDDTINRKERYPDCPSINTDLFYSKEEGNNLISSELSDIIQRAVQKAEEEQNQAI